NKCSNNNVDDMACTANFKKHINANNEPSLFIVKIKEQSKSLSQELTLKDVYNVINSSLVVPYYGHPNSKLVTLLLNKHHVYFLIGKYDELHLIIDNIYLEDGQSVYNQLYVENKNYLKLIGKIVDKDGFTNIRTQADIKSAIVDKIPSGEEIWYTPNDDYSWWRIESKTNPNLKGFVYFNRISQNSSIQ
ncbi:MAG: SH3 domain-containing protein, partial [Sphingobacteriales bacterium]